MAPHIVASHIQGAVSGAVFRDGAIVPPHRIVGIRVMIIGFFPSAISSNGSFQSVRSIGSLPNRLFSPGQSSLFHRPNQLFPQSLFQSAIYNRLMLLRRKLHCVFKRRMTSLITRQFQSHW